jgi:tRNA (guanine-N7-)-methyltransferase
MRHRYHPQAEPTVRQSPYIVKEIPPSHRLIVEVGCGKGQFLIQQAMLHSDVLYVGIEQSAQALYRALQSLDITPLENIRFLWGNVDEVVPHLPSSIEHLYLLFSDPWPKVRHEKRRLTTKDRLLLYAKHGVQRLTLKTDNVDFFHYSLHCFEDSPFQVYHHGNAPLVESELTEFETKYRHKNKPIYIIEASR